MATVITDRLDYAPEEKAGIIADGYAPGSTIEFQVQHVISEGDDGIWGTSDDVLGDNSGSGHTPWYVTDGIWSIVDFGVDGIEGTSDDIITGDLDKTVNGAITTDWYVNPDDSANEKFKLTALGTGSDLLFATDDDELATAFFTDSIPTGNRLTAHEVWEKTNPSNPTGEYVPGLVTGYREGEAASFVIAVQVTAADLAAGDDGKTRTTADNGILHLDFNIVLDLVADSGSLGYAFSDLADFDGTVKPPIPNDIVNAGYTYNIAENLGSTGGTGNGSVTVLQPNDGSDSIQLTGVSYLGADFSGSTNDQTWNVSYEVTGAGTYYFLYGGKLARTGDIVPAEGGGTTSVDLGAGYAGNFQAIVETQGTGAKTVPFKGGLITIVPDITVTKQIDRDANGSFEDVANAGEYQFNLYRDDGDGIIEIETQDVAYGSQFTDSTGQVLFQDVPNGTYWIAEEQKDFSEGTYTFANGIINKSGTPSGFIGDIAKVTVSAGSSLNVKEADVIFQNAPVPFPPPNSVTVTKFVSVDGGDNWFDANSVTGPSLLDGFDNPWFKYTITNGSNAATDVKLTDDKFDLDGVSGDTVSGDHAYTINLAKDTSVDVIFDGAAWKEGQHTNIGTVEYTSTEGVSTDDDPANYFGATAGYTIEKQVSVDGGTTWLDADSPTGPTLLASGDAPQFRVLITNTGNVGITVDLEDNLLPGLAATSVLVAAGSTNTVLGCQSTFKIYQVSTSKSCQLQVLKFSC